MIAVKSFIVQASLFKAAFSRLSPVFDSLLATLHFFCSFAYVYFSYERIEDEVPGQRAKVHLRRWTWSQCYNTFLRS
jgi:hypothetical protein